MPNKIRDERIFIDTNLLDEKIQMQSLPEKLKSKGGRDCTSKHISDEANPNIYPIEPGNLIM